MSGIFKGIAKIFKKVAKAIVKIAPAVLAAGALFFTGGAALGISSASGGWAGAAAKISSVLGATGTVGSALTGAITMAGQGALIGGGIAAVTGGDVMKGLRAGALGGAALGGATGAGMFSPSGVMTDPAAAMGSNGPIPQGTPTIMGPSGGTTPSGGGLLSSVGGFISKNPGVVGSVISGIGQGLIARGTSEAEMEAMRERDRARAANYRGADPSAEFVPAAPGTSGMSPTERFDPRIYGSFEFVYNPKSGRIEKVPTGGRGG